MRRKRQVRIFGSHPVEEEEEDDIADDENDETNNLTDIQKVNIYSINMHLECSSFINSIIYRAIWTKLSMSTKHPKSAPRRQWPMLHDWPRNCDR